MRSSLSHSLVNNIQISTVIFWVCDDGCNCRAPGPEYLQVTHGDMSVPEGGAAADDLAGLPAGRGGELPEQGS